MSKHYIRDMMRSHLVTIGQNNDKVVVVNADLARSCKSDGFVEAFPNRSFNVGIAEQNMVSFAAGLACEGFIPFIFTMAPFLTMRAFEQIRDDVAYGNRNVKLVGTYAGVSGGVQGATHWGLEDCGIIRSVANMTIFEPSDAIIMNKLLDCASIYKGPVYIRYGYFEAEDIHNENIQVKVGGSLPLLDGDDGAILCSGIVTHFALEASRRIKEKTGKNIRVVEMYSIKPIDKEAVLSAAKTNNVLVVQDHNIIGGLGSGVAQIIAEEGLSVHFKILGINDRFVAMARPQYLYHLFGIDAEGIEKTMLEMLDNK